MAKKLKLKLKSKKIVVVADRLLLLRAARRLHGRFWGIVGLFGLTTGLVICFLITPELFEPSTAFSDFSKDIRTAPYFAGSIFFGAYGLWRWRNYVSRTFKRPNLSVLLITTTIIGLYIVALMPVAWGDRAYAVHIFGFVLAGASMALTVFADLLLRKTRKSKKRRQWQLIRIASILFIVAGGAITALSTEKNNILQAALIGESLILVGFGMWVFVKTYQGEGPRSRLSKVMSKVVIVE